MTIMSLPPPPCASTNLTCPAGTWKTWAPGCVESKSNGPANEGDAWSCIKKSPLCVIVSFSGASVPLKIAREPSMWASNEALAAVGPTSAASAIVAKIAGARRREAVGMSRPVGR
jgi:hypothetical protein